MAPGNGATRFFWPLAWKQQCQPSKISVLSEQEQLVKTQTKNNNKKKVKEKKHNKQNRTISDVWQNKEKNINLGSGEKEKQIITSGPKPS